MKRSRDNHRRKRGDYRKPESPFYFLVSIAVDTPQACLLRTRWKATGGVLNESQKGARPDS